MYADPAVVRRKVERELREYVERIDEYRARGIWVLEYFFPELLVVFAARRVTPTIAPYGVLLDLRNYDVEPPSIRFVNPFTRASLKASEMLTIFPRLTFTGQRPAPGPDAVGPVQINPQDLRQDRLLQAWSPDDESPFICLQGVREYHDNPGHTGDRWWLHRASGAGRIVRLLDILSRYGTEQMTQLIYEIKFREVQQELTVAL